jgi:hypothetical protein
MLRITTSHSAEAAEKYFDLALKTSDYYTKLFALLLQRDHQGVLALVDHIEATDWWDDYRLAKTTNGTLAPKAICANPGPIIEPPATPHAEP